MPEKGSNPLFMHFSSFSRRFSIVLVALFVGVLVIWSIDGSIVRGSLISWRSGRNYIALKLHKPANLTEVSSPLERNTSRVDGISSVDSTLEKNTSRVDVIPSLDSTLEKNTSRVEEVSSLESALKKNTSRVDGISSVDSTLEKNTSGVDVISSLDSTLEEENISGVEEVSSLESTLKKNMSKVDGISSLNSTQESQALDNGLDWIKVELESNYSSNLLARWLAPGGEPCRESMTDGIMIPSLDGDNVKELPAGDVHEFVFHALDADGNRRCLGGDYFEIDLSGDSWKSRPPIEDCGDGSYSFKFQVHPKFVGEYNLTIVLLYRHFEGLRFTPAKFVLWKELRRIPVRFLKSSAELPELQICRKSDFGRDVWSGRWTRLGKNEECQIDNDGRYRCLKADFPCQKPWCEGALGALESNGWVYSTHCSFKIFACDSAWDCLQNRWIFFWGDSNHVDSIRNLLNFVLGLSDIASVPRRFDRNFTNPNNASQSVRITSIFNGHWNETMNYQGLNSLQNEEFRNLLKRYFSEETVPDTIIMNSGLHDGVYWKNIRTFVKGAEYAAKFWEGVIASVKQRGLQPPQLLYRTTIATGGYARGLAFNPNKMEVFNGVVLDKLKSVGILSGVIDDFDMTFPWHYDNRCNDGVHYGRAPAKAKWRDGEIGHQYFVDLMLEHVLLNSLCSRG